MTDLLALAVEAHGGLERWNTVKSIDVELSITGPIWQVKGRPDVLRTIAMRVEVEQERVGVLVAIDMTTVTVTS